MEAVGPPVKALAKEKGHAATAWGEFNRLRPLRSLDIKLNVIHLSPKSDSPLRAKAVDNTNKHTNAHTNTQVYLYRLS